MGKVDVPYGDAQFTDAASGALLTEQYSFGDGRYITDASKANSFSNAGGDIGSAIGHIEFTDTSYDAACPLFRVEPKKGKYNYNMCKIGWDCNYSKAQIPLFYTVEDARSSKIIQRGTASNLKVSACIGFGDPAFSSKPKEDKFWSKAIYICHNETTVKDMYKYGITDKKVDSKKKMCPCVIIDDEKRGGDKYGYNSDKNGSTDYHRLGNFGYMDKLYIFALYYDGSEAYIYCAAPFYRWWQSEGVWEIVQGLKCNYKTDIAASVGWVKLSTVLSESTIKTTLYMPDEQTLLERAPKVATADISAQDYVSSVASLSYDATRLSPYCNVHSIIGLPFSFLSNTDLKYGHAGSPNEGKTFYGHEYLENIIYDMPIAVIRPGTPESGGQSDLFSSIKDSVIGVVSYLVNRGNAGDMFKSALSTFMSADYERFYTFGSNYAEYIQYTNTLCHLFATFLGIADKESPTSMGLSGGNGIKTYGQYDDTISAIDVKNEQFQAQFGTSPAVFMYYQPDSQLSATFSTQTSESSVSSTIADAVEKKRQFDFFGTALGLGNFTGDGGLLNGVLEAAADTVSTFLGGMGILGEGASSLILGNNMSLPEIWSDSTTEVQHNIKVKLVSPYGDEESIFLHVLRPLARLMALACPHQTGKNSYTAPFVVQAFSKGQFNCQLGIITSLSITRGGEGGESHTVHHIPTELMVDITITDMYEKIMLSNEYNNGRLLSGISLSAWKQQFGLLVNNIGLMDFVASYAGFNLNSPSSDLQMSLLANVLKNRVNNAFMTVDAAGKIRFPAWDRALIDAYNDTVNKSQTFISS